MNKLKQKDMSFLLTICFMTVLIVSIMIPASMAWFTDRNEDTNRTTINFATVNINVDKDKTEFTATRAINNLLPGDHIYFTSKLSNENSTVSVYAGVSSYIKIIYTKESYEPQDITQLFQPYLDVTPLSIDSADIIDGTQGITLLDAGEAVDLTGSVYFDTSLPNVIGEVEEYKNKMLIELHILYHLLIFFLLPRDFLHRIFCVLE